MQLYRKGDTVNIKEIGTVQKVLSWQTGSLLCYLACCGHHCKQGKDSCQENQCVHLSILSTLRAETSPETGEGKQPGRARHLGSAQPREAL